MIAQRPSDLTWQTVWRKTIAPRLPRRGLEALRQALLCDDQSLVQGRTIVPSPLVAEQNDNVVAACAIAFCGWKGADCATVDRLEIFFDDFLEMADLGAGGPNAECRRFLDWFDDTPRPIMRRELLAEVEQYLAENQ